MSERYTEHGTCGICGEPRMTYEWDGIDLCNQCSKEVLEPSDRQAWFNQFVRVVSRRLRERSVPASEL